MSCAPPPVVLTVAAHDPLGGAGLAADLSTFAALGVHGVSVATALTAQHLQSVDLIEPASPDLVAAQFDGIVAGFTVAAAKLGLLGSCEIVEIVIERIDRGDLPAPVVDPVFVDGRGRRFVAPQVEQAYRSGLIPRARIVTPNVAEASLLVGRELSSVDDIIAAADELAALGADTVVVTGGSLSGGARSEESTAARTCVDVVVGSDGEIELLEAPHISSVNVRGSGCTFAAATAAMLAQGADSAAALRAAKCFVGDRISAGSVWNLGPGVRGPVGHWF